ncbi:hypothetical protein FBU30_006469 [Linnemannia zychae]|nr:hypothetical protein FBU30_006469 [Linnemannia zychae]
MKNSHGDTLRVHLAKSRDFVGLRSTRCQRKYNQDRYKVVVLDAPQLDATATATTTVITAPATGGSSNSHTISQIDANHKTLFYFAIFDGHGGSNTADYLTANLDHYIESAKPEMVPQVIKDLRKIGGYFRNFRPHFMEPFLPLDFEKSRSGGLGHQRKVHIPGKGGKVRPMIFIPHPNATEAEQEQEIQSLEMATNTGVGHSRSPATLSGTPLSNEQRIQKERAAASLTDIDMNQKAINEVVEEEVYDEYHDPLEITKRRNLNRTSPLPEGTTPYFGTDRSEYALLSLRKDDKAEKERRKIAEAATASSIPTTMTLEQRLCLAFLKCDTELIQDKYRDGSTASVVIVQSKGAFWETKDDLDLIIAHVGDTRILLCEAPRGESIQLTTDHHPDAIVESGTQILWFSIAHDPKWMYPKE